MGLRGSGSSADPGSWSTFNGSPASIQLLPTAPQEGDPLPVQGVERVEVQSWQRPAVVKSRHTQRLPQAEAGGRSRNLIS